MSSEESIKDPVCANELIQDDCEKVVENFNCVQLKGNETSYSFLSRVNDGFRNTSCSEIVSGVVDLSSFSLCNTSHLQIGTIDQLRPNNAEDWLRLTTDVNLEEYGITKTEAGCHFSPGVISHDFVSSKRNEVDMCINNDESASELDLHVPENNSGCEKNKFSNLSEFLFRTSDNGSSTLLNGFTESDSFLNYLEKTDILGKDVLLENVASTDANKLTESTSNFDSASSNMEYSLTDICPSLEKHAEESDLNIPQSELEIDKDATPWEHLYINKHTDESVRETDYPEFNLLTFHVELCDSLSLQDDNVGVTKVLEKGQKCDVSDKQQICDEPHSVEIPPEVQTAAVKVVDSEPRKNSGVAQSLPCILKTKTKVAVPNPRSILKTAQTVNDPKISSIFKPSTTPKCAIQNSVAKMETNDSSGKKPDTKGMAFVAISTDKYKNTTEIVINTARGEQVLKGKTSDLMKATSNLWVKLEKISNNNTEQTLTISTVKEDVKQTTLTRDKKTHNGKNGVRRLVMGQDVCINFQGSSGSEEGAEERPPLDALKEHNLPMEYTSCMISDTKYWLCPIDDCRRVYPRKSMVRIHVLSHYGIRPFRCDVDGCQWSFYSYFKLKRHKETHLKKKDFQCERPECGKKFTTVYNLHAHQKLHCRPAKVACQVEGCAASFQTRRGLEQHMKSHDIRHAPFRCPFKGCTKRYFAANILTSHMRCHQHKEEELRCQWDGCNKLFDKPCRLRAHTRVHTGDKPYLCNHQGCGGAFQTSSKLKRHQAKHSNLRKYSCTVEGCSKSFYRGEHMKEHALTHVGHRIFKCPMENCSVTFTARSSLYVHMKKHDKRAPGAGPASHRCPVDRCEKAFGSRAGLRQHVLAEHGPTSASDSNQLDYISLLTDSNDLGNTEGLQLFGDATQLTGAAGSPNTTSVTPQSVGATNTANAELPASREVALQLGTASFVIPQPDHQARADERGDATEDATCRAARTHVTLGDVVREKQRAEPPSSLGLEDDVALGSGQEPAAGFMVQEDLPITHYFYQDEPEFQILLLDPIDSPQEFAESTINLRDLE
ncbi:protein suppressor of hairy wing-like isoform X2 [Bacillus rossius redtenbacheri]|uniref:protein suppressor of hairy wing-like isoform X2 n=1 Tax=Bacillus rossius redtenbacheri TaxID=93214 RepID=UPI002FDCE4CD